jgi:hypothetical protein
MRPRNDPHLTWQHRTQLLQSVAFSPGTGKSHLRVALGAAAVAAGHKVRYYTAAELTETLYRGLADNSVGKVIDTLLRNDLILIDEVGFAPLDHTGAQLLFRVVAACRPRTTRRASAGTTVRRCGGHRCRLVASSGYPATTALSSGLADPAKCRAGADVPQAASLMWCGGSGRISASEAPPGPS